MMLVLDKITRNAVQEISHRFGESEWLRELRLRAFDEYEKLDYPNFRYGTTIRVDYNELDLSAIDPIAQVQKAGSSTDNQNNSLNAAIKEHPALIKKYLTKVFDFRKNKFAAMHAAFFNSGVFVHAEKGEKKEVRINEVNGSGSNFWHALVVADEGSELTVVFESESNDYNPVQKFRSSAIEVFAKQNAKVKVITVQNCDKNTFSFEDKAAQLEKDASIEWIDVGLGGVFTNSETVTYLDGTGAQSLNSALFVGDSEQQFNFASDAIHSASNTKSLMSARGVLDGSAKAVYRGLIHIKKDAQNCNGYQKEDVLLLSKNAEADSIPTLEIDNNEVRCSHGATISQIDNEKLFYLMSRGLARKEAEKLVVLGFLLPMLGKINDEDLRETVKEMVVVKLG